MESESGVEKVKLKNKMNVRVTRCLETGEMDQEVDSKE